MRLHERVKVQESILDDIQNDIQDFLEYLALPKFEGENNWIRTNEVSYLLKNLRLKVQG